MSQTSSRAAAPLAAYVLHRYDWSESSLILDLFTRAEGRIVVAEDQPFARPLPPLETLT